MTFQKKDIHLKTNNLQKTKNKQTYTKHKLKISTFNRKKPQRFFIWILIILSIGIGTVYLISRFTEPEPITIPIPSDTEKLQELIDKVVAGVLISEIEWKDLCRLLSVVKNIDINSCDECRNYTTALLGGKHGKWMQEYIDLPDKNLTKGIKSFDKQIQLHIDKINNPKKYYPNWDNLNPLRKNHLINTKWKKDIKRQREQKEILECILKNR